MNLQFTPFTAPLQLGALLLISIAVIALKKRDSIPVRYLIASNLLLAIYLISYSGELTQSTVEGVFFWSKIEYIGWVPVFPMLLLLTLAYTGRRRSLSLLNHLLILFIPALTIVITWTNEYHELIWKDSFMVPAGTLTLIEFTPGGWYWVNIAYCYLLAVITITLLVTSARKTNRAYRQQYLLMLAAMLVPFIAHFVYLGNLLLGHHDILINIQAYAMLMTALIISSGVLTTNLFDITPVAREAIIEQLADGIIVFDSTQRTLEMNPAAAAMLSLNRNEVIGKPMTKVFTEEQLLQIADRAAPMRGRVELKTGGRVYEVNANQIQFRGSSDVGEMVVLHDITHRIKSESEIRKLSQAVEQNINAMVIADPEGTIEYVNAAFTTLTGYSRLDAVGSTPGALNIGPRDPDQNNVLWQIIRKGGDWQGVYEAYRKDGTTYWESMSVKPIINKRGEITHFLSIRDDITNRKMVEEELKASSDRNNVLRQVGVELSRRMKLDYVLNIAVDATLRLTGADACFIVLVRGGRLMITRAIGHYYEEMEGTFIEPELPTITARVARTQQAEYIKDVFSDPDYLLVSPEIVSQISIPLITKDKLIGVLTVETSHQESFTDEIFTSLNLLATQIAIAIDNAIMVEEREHLIGELDAYAHTVAHDLKQPLSLVIGYLDLLKKYAVDQLDEDSRGYVEEAYQGGKKLQRIIEELLLLATVRDQAVIPREEIKTDNLIRGALGRLKAVIIESGATVKQPKHWPAVESYGPWVEEVWTNYISNAIKYGGDPPMIELGSERLIDGRVRFWVKDNGPGLTVDGQTHLFRQFERLEQTKTEGYGLGLSVVRRIIERLGGEAGVESTIGEGSLFYFILPATTPEEIPDIIA